MFSREMERTLTSTCIKRVSHKLAVLLILALSTASGSAPPSDVASILKALGEGTSEIVQIQALAKSPDESIPLLINELHVVPSRSLLNGQHPFKVEHVLWCVRALRFMTGGRDFCAPTSHVFGSSEVEQNRKYWLEFRYRASCLTFFAIWPSRISTYIAPVDAQRRIIQQWREWYRNEGRKTSYTPFKDPKPEDWLW